MRHHFTIVVLAFVAASFAQQGYQARSEVSDTSRHGSPMRVSGYVKLSVDNPANITRYTHHVEASATNVGLRPILFFSIRFQTSGGSIPALDFKQQNDYLFGNDVLTTGMSESIDSSLPTLSPPIVNGVPQILRIDPSAATLTGTAQVEFVQFQDGSTWGDRELAEDFFKDRKAQLRQLETLEHIYAEQGEQAFTDALSRSPNLPCIEHVKVVCRDKDNNASCSLETIRRMLASATTAMNNHS